MSPLALSKKVATNIQDLKKNDTKSKRILGIKVDSNLTR